MSEAQKFEILKASGELIWGPWGAWAYDTWAELNKQYFDNKLKIGGIIWGLTPHGGALGIYFPRHNLIVLHTMLAERRNWHPWDIKGDDAYARDVLLHEMIHMSIRQSGVLVGKDHHNNPAWAAEINRVAKLLGIDVHAECIKQRRVRDGNGKTTRQRTRAPVEGNLELKDISRFPHSVRPAGFYKKKEPSHITLCDK